MEVVELVDAMPREIRLRNVPRRHWAFQVPKPRKQKLKENKPALQLLHSSPHFLLAELLGGPPMNLDAGRQHSPESDADGPEYRQHRCGLVAQHRHEDCRS